MIPMVDLKKQFNEIRKEINDVLEEILQSTHFILGPKVRELEQKVSAYTKTEDAVGVASGTDALHLALKALGIGKGDEVITTPFTFFATVEAIIYLGARPVFVDIEPETFNIDPEKIERAITKNTKAIVPVHIFGHPADMTKITEIARHYGLKIVEDCAQSFGASINGKLTGSFGDAGCFSFYPSKNLGAYGDGGMVVVKDREVADEIRRLRNHGSKATYIHSTIGFNSRLDEIQAGILLVKFKRIDIYNEKRRSRAELYTRALSGSNIRCPSEREGFRHVYHQYSIMSPKRDEIQKALRENSISSAIYYPVPMHIQEALKDLGYKEGDFPIAEQVSKEIISLPIYPELEDSQIEHIAGIIKNV